MKNFRKVLALILVVATLFSFVAMASAKTSEDYSDAAEIKYVEAVDVLSAVGILKGYDGAYHPTDDVDRDEMAKMIAVLNNGGEDNSALFSGANKFADVKGSWAEGYIAYCAQLGIVAGRNATTFDPDGKVTGIEVMKMLLCVLGYDAKEQGYVGSNWKTNVLRDATKMGLMEAMEGFDPHAAASRDEAAQLMLNALKANMIVGYLGESIIKITNSLYFDEEFISLPDAEKDGYEIAYCNAVISTVPLYTIIDGLDVDFARDCFGRPGYLWSYTPVANAEFSAFYALEAETVMTAPDSNTLRRTLVNMTIRDREETMEEALVGEWEVYVDGELRTVADFANVGNGTLVEVYNTVFAGEVIRDVVIINTWVSRVTNVSTYYNYFELESGEKYRLNEYDLEEDDIVLYHICNKQIQDNIYGLTSDNESDNLHDIQAITPVVAEIESGFAFNANYWQNPNASYVIADGESYNYANTFNAQFSTRAVMGVALDAEISQFDMIDVIGTDHLFDLYLDEYGYLIFWQKHVEDADLNIMVIEENDVTSTNLGSVLNPSTGVAQGYNKYTAVAAPYGADGEVVAAEIEIDVVTYNYMAELLARYDVDTLVGGAEQNRGPAALVAMTTNVDEEPVLATIEGEDYDVADDTLAEIQGKYMVGTFATEGTVLNPESFELKEGEIHANRNTVFMIRTLTGDRRAPYAYQQVTGYKNLPATFVAEDLSNGSNTTFTNIQYFVDEDHPEFATYVFIDARYTTGAEHFMILTQSRGHGFETKWENIFGKDYVCYDAIVDGVNSVILADPDAIATYEEAASGTTVAPFMPGYLYENSLVYLNVEMTYSGERYNVYVLAEEAEENEIEMVDYTWAVADDEIYVKVFNDATHTTYKMYELASDAAVWTLFATSTKVVAEQVYVDIRESEGLVGWEPVEDRLDPDFDPDEYVGPSADTFYTGYMVLNEETEQVEELYQITGNAHNFWDTSSRMEGSNYDDSL